MLRRVLIVGGTLLGLGVVVLIALLLGRLVASAGLSLEDVRNIGQASQDFAATLGIIGAAVWGLYVFVLGSTATSHVHLQLGIKKVVDTSEARQLCYL